MRLSRPTLTLILAGAAAATALGALSLPLLGQHLATTLHALADASRPWLAASFLAFLGAFVCTVGAWRSALSAAGARLCPKQAAARLGIGSMVNAFTPAKLGDAVKITLCARAIDSPDRIWTATGTYTALAAARSLTPGGFGIGGGAVAVAPASRGIGMTDALATGLAIQAVETMVSVTSGSLGLAYLMQPSERVSRVAARTALAGGAAALAAVLGAAILNFV